MESFLEKVSGEEIVRNSFSNRVSYWKVDCLSCRLRLCHHLIQFSVSSKPSCFHHGFNFLGLRKEIDLYSKE